MLNDDDEQRGDELHMTRDYDENRLTVSQPDGSYSVPLDSATPADYCPGPVSLPPSRWR